MILVYTENNPNKLIRVQINLAKKWVKLKEKVHNGEEINIKQFDFIVNAECYFAKLPKATFNEIINWI